MAEVSNDFKNGLAAGLSMGKVKVIVGQGGTSDYNDLSNKPSINGVELKGDLTSEELHIVGGGVGWLGNGENAEKFNDINNIANGNYSHAEGAGTKAMASYAHAEGGATIAGHYNADISSTALGNNAHAEGGGCIAAHSYSHAEGSSTQALAPYSHTEGGGTQALASGAHAEGNGCIAGYATRQSSLNYYTCDGTGAHAEGNGTIAAGVGSHSGGNGSLAEADCSFAHGSRVVMESENGVCFGINNLTRKDVAFVIGNGNAETSSDALTVDWDGNLKVSGTITDGEGNSLSDLAFKIGILEVGLDEINGEVI